MSQRSDAILINCHHDLDVSTTEALGRTINDAARASVRLVVVSLAECKFCDASGLQIFLKAKATLGKRLAIVVPNAASVRRVFDRSSHSLNGGACP